jgi:glycosyltransferase involved in cell wall biosynthesis
MSAPPEILLLHNRYREPGGEERSLAEMATLLRSRGHRVDLLERSSGSLSGASGRLRAGTALLRGGVRRSDEVTETLRQTGGRIVHAHNVLPLLGPRALQAARAAGARVVMHLHNYRLFCAIGIGYRDHDRCTRCHGRYTWPGVRLRCRGNLPEAAVYGAALALHQGELIEQVDRFVVPSTAAASRLGEFGLPLEPVSVLHNFVGSSEFVARSAAGSGEYALVAGRLVEEKGVDTAIEAARRAEVPLLVAGSGRDAARLERLAAGAPVRLAGRLSAEDMADARARAAFALAPSRWDEPCPYSVIEAMAAGVPVLASRVGGLPEMVGDAQTVDARDVDGWANAMRELWNDEELRQERGNQALARARELFGEERFYSGLMAIYDEALASGTEART